MDAKELRIGNLIYSRTGVIKVVDVINATTRKIEFDDSDDDYDLSECNPIPLTAEWLERFGAEFSGNEVVIQGFVMELFRDGYCYSGGEGCPFSPPIKYVHKLQNIFYEIEDKELKDSMKSYPVPDRFPQVKN